MASLRKLANQTALYGLSSILGRAINWLLTPVFVNVFAPAEYGILQDLYALTYYPLILLTLGQETAYFRWATDQPDPDRAYRNAWAQVIGLAVSFGAVVAVLHPWLSEALGYGARPDLLLLVLGILVLDVLAALPMARLRFQERAKRFALISLGNIFVLLSLNLVFLFGLGWQSVEAILWANLVASGLKFGASLVQNLPAEWRPDRAGMAAMRQYGVFIMLAGLGGALNEALDRNLLPRLWPAGQVFAGKPRTGFELNGIYSAMYKLGMLISLATQAFRYAAEPFFFRQAQADRASGGRTSPQTFARVFHYYMLAGIALFVLVAGFRREIVGFTGFGLLNGPLIPESYWVGLDAVPIILGANLLLGAYVNLSIWFKLTKQVRYALVFTGLGAAITVAGNLLFIPTYGFWACAYTTLIAYTAMTAAVYWVGQRHYPVPYRWRPLLLAGAAAVLLVLLLDAIPFYGFPTTLVKLMLVGSITPFLLSKNRLS